MKEGATKLTYSERSHIAILATELAALVRPENAHEWNSYKEARAVQLGRQVFSVLSRAESV